MAERLHPKAVGDATEAMVLARLVQAYPDAEILSPFGENSRYDLAIDTGERFVRVQCKTGRLRNGTIRFNTCSFSYHHPKNRGSMKYRHDYRGDADAFAVYCPETDGVYLVPVDEVGVRQGGLRVLPTRNNQTKLVRWAKDFQVQAGLAHLVEQVTCNDQAVGSSPTPGSIVEDQGQRRLFGHGTSQSGTGN